MRVCLRVFMCTWIMKCVCMRVYTSVCMYVCMYVCVYVFMYVYAYVCMYMHGCVHCVCVYLVLPLARHDLSIDSTDWDLISINIEKGNCESREEERREEKN